MTRYTIPGSHPIRQVRLRVGDARLIPTEVWQPPPAPPPPPPPPTPPPPVAPPPIDFSALIVNLEDLIRDHEDKRKQSSGEFQQLAIELAVAVASHVVHKAIEDDQFGIRTLVESMVERLGLNEPLRISLHPLDLKQLQDQLSKTPPNWPADEVTFVPDTQLPRGSCRGSSRRNELLSEAALHLADLRRHLLEGLDDAEIERRQTPGADQRMRRFPDRRETA